MSESGKGTTEQSVLELGPGDHGRWLITTKSSRHMWDLDAGTYQRLPGDDGPAFDWDGRVVRITKVDRWPAVGGKSLIWFDDPEMPDELEQWRRSATIVSIERLPEAATSAGHDQ